jgi:hypothetical protein
VDSVPQSKNQQSSVLPTGRNGYLAHRQRCIPKFLPPTPLLPSKRFEDMPTLTGRSKRLIAPRHKPLPPPHRLRCSECHPTMLRLCHTDGTCFTLLYTTTIDRLLSRIIVTLLSLSAGMLCTMYRGCNSLCISLAVVSTSSVSVQ